MNLYVRDRVAKTVLGFDVPTTWFLSLNPLVVILGGPFVSRFWTAKLGNTSKSGKRARVAALDRILAGTVLMALSYVLMGLVDLAAGQGLVAPVWIVVFYIVITIAELCVFPIGLAEISRRAPREMVGLLMGFWVFTMGFGSLVAGWLGGLMADAPNWMIFAVLAAGGMLSALVLLMVEPVVRKLKLANPRIQVKFDRFVMTDLAPRRTRDREQMDKTRFSNPSTMPPCGRGGSPAYDGPQPRGWDGQGAAALQSAADCGAASLPTLLAAALLLAAFFAALPFRNVLLVRIDAFIPLYDNTILLGDWITATLLFAQGAVLRSRALVALATGYFFTGLIIIPHALAFPFRFFAEPDC